MLLFLYLDTKVKPWFHKVTGNYRLWMYSWYCDTTNEENDLLHTSQQTAINDNV